MGEVPLYQHGRHIQIDEGGHLVGDVVLAPADGVDQWVRLVLRLEFRVEG